MAINFVLIQSALDQHEINLREFRVAQIHIELIIYFFLVIFLFFFNRGQAPYFLIESLDSLILQSDSWKKTTKDQTYQD